MAIEVIFAACLSLVVLQLLVNSLRPGLSSFPGPWAAKFTDLWRLNEIFRKRQPQTIQKLHRKYGIAVRTGPNVIDISDPALIEPVYGTKTDFIKVRRF